MPTWTITPDNPVTPTSFAVAPDPGASPYASATLAFNATHAAASDGDIIDLATGVYPMEDALTMPAKPLIDGPWGTGAEIGETYAFDYVSNTKNIKWRGPVDKSAVIRSTVITPDLNTIPPVTGFVFHNPHGTEDQRPSMDNITFNWMTYPTNLFAAVDLNSCVFENCSEGIISHLDERTFCVDPDNGDYRLKELSLVDSCEFKENLAFANVFIGTGGIKFRNCSFTKWNDLSPVWGGFNAFAVWIMGVWQDISGYQGRISHIYFEGCTFDLTNHVVAHTQRNGVIVQAAWGPVSDIYMDDCDITNVAEKLQNHICFVGRQSPDRNTRGNMRDVHFSRVRISGAAKEESILITSAENPFGDLEGKNTIDDITMTEMTFTNTKPAAVVSPMIYLRPAKGYISRAVINGDFSASGWTATSDFSKAMIAVEGGCFNGTYSFAENIPPATDVEDLLSMDRGVIDFNVVLGGVPNATTPNYSWSF